ncbi:YxeA family protein [Virgibacillus sp. NKC19-3]|nr:YxeA family protein [Virgibacillus sp. NKC19-3]
MRKPFSAGDKLKKEAYIKVYAKGDYVKTWEEVSFEELPSQAKQ